MNLQEVFYQESSSNVAGGSTTSTRLIGVINVLRDFYIRRVTARCNYRDLTTLQGFACRGRIRFTIGGYIRQVPPFNVVTGFDAVDPFAYFSEGHPTEYFQGFLLSAGQQVTVEMIVDYNAVTVNLGSIFPLFMFGYEISDGIPEGSKAFEWLPTLKNKPFGSLE